MKPMLWLIPVLPLLLAIGALLLNRPAWLAPPGPWSRLKTYLSSNVAQTAPDSPFPELRTPRFALSCEPLRQLLLERMHVLGWRVVERQPTRLSATVTTPLWHFTDDVQVDLEPVDTGCDLHLRSASRVGRADFGANQHHLMLLLHRLAPRLPGGG